MAITEYDFVRGLIGDRRKAAVNENVGEGDGANRFFQFDTYPLASGPTAFTVIFITGSTAATSSYVLSGMQGKLTFNAGSEPAAGGTLIANYEYHAISSGELTQIMSGHTGRPYLVAANALLLIAADSARLFAYTMGNKKIDKTMIAKNLRETSQMYEKRHYSMLKDSSYTATVFTFKDNTGTPYEGYDTGAAYLTGTS